jgi:hypothetical protein
MDDWYRAAKAAIDEEMPPISVACDKALAQLQAQNALDAAAGRRRSVGVRKVKATIDEGIGRSASDLMERLGHERDTRFLGSCVRPLPEGDVERHIDAWRWDRKGA